jgi:hypothetical protein
MISNLNIYYYSDLIDFFNEQNLTYLCKQITEPDHFSPSNLPKHVKDIIKEKNQKYSNDINGFLNIDKSDINLITLKKEIHRQDLLKTISIVDYMPEIAKLIIDN